MAATPATPAVEQRSDAQRLRDQAKSLHAHADALKEQRMEVLREAWSLEATADRLDAETTRPSTAPKLAVVGIKHPETDTAVLERVAEFLATVEDATSASVAEHVNLTQTRARTALARLEAIGLVRRSGLKRGTRYMLIPEDSPAPEPTRAEDNVRAFGNYETLVRDAIVTLGTFDFSDLQLELGSVSENTLRRWLRSFEQAGMIESERVDGAKLYAYVKPEGDTRARPKHARPEDVARRTVRGAVAGTGRARVGTPLVDELIREASSYGVTWTTSKHRVEFRLDGRIVATASKTPGASSLKQTRADLRRAGVPV